MPAGAGLYRGILSATTPQITNPGGYGREPELLPRSVAPAPARARMALATRRQDQFSHLQLATTVYDWQGAQIALICFDELTHFTASQFFYMASRNRSTCGVKPYIRATCNPDADAGRRVPGWWIDQETGLPILSVPAFCAITFVFRTKSSGPIARKP